MKRASGAVGIFGGSFNPVHRGHVRLVERVQSSLGFRPLWVVPCNVQPLKGRPELAGADRLRMLRLAFRGRRNVRVSDHELKGRGRSYTYSTIRHFIRKYPGLPISFVVGADAFAEFSRWYRYRDILDLCSVVVVARPRARGVASSLRKLARRGLVREVHPQRPFSRVFATESGTVIGILDVYTADVSSTQVRRSLSGGIVPSRLLPGPVARYLRGMSKDRTG